jgi:hypothetical protein
MEKVTLELDVDSSSGAKGTQSLKARIKEAQQEAQVLAEKFGATSKQAIQAAKNAANLKEELSDIKQTIDALHPEAKFNAVIGVAQGIAGGFAAAQGAMALFGVEGENVQKAMLKVQAALAISQGLNEINGLKDSFQNLGIVVRNGTVYTKAAAAAQLAYSTVVGTSTGALKLFRLALVATGLGAFAVAIGMLIANWDEVKERIDKNSEAVKKWGAIFGAILFPAVAIIVAQFLLLKKGLDYVSERFDFVKSITSKVSEQFGILKDKIMELLVAVGLLDSVEEERAQKNMEASKVREKQIQRQIELYKAEGKSAQEIAALEVSLARERFLAYDQMIKAKIKAGRDITDAEKEQLSDLAFELKKAKAAEQKTIDDADKKQADELKKKRDENLRKAQEYNKYLLDIQKQLEDAEINSIKDSHQRELAQINHNYEAKIAAIKGNSEKELSLKELLLAEQSQAIQTLNDKYAQENLVKAGEEIKKAFSDKMALLDAQKIEAEMNNEQTFQIERQQAALRKNQALTDTALSEEERKLVIAKYNKEIFDIDKKAADDRKKIEQQLSAAKLTLAQTTLNGLSSLGTLITNNSSKQAAISKGIAVGQLAIDEAKAIGAIVAGATEAAEATGPGAPFALPIFIAEGLANILGPLAVAKKALGSSGSSTPSLSGGGGSAQSVQPPQFNATNTPVTNVNKQQDLNVSVNANVIEYDMSRSQKRVSDIQNRAQFP